MCGGALQLVDVDGGYATEGYAFGGGGVAGESGALDEGAVVVAQFFEVCQHVVVAKACGEGVAGGLQRIEALAFRRAVP